MWQRIKPLKNTEYINVSSIFLLHQLCCYRWALLCLSFSVLAGNASQDGRYYLSHGWRAKVDLKCAFQRAGPSVVTAVVNRHATERLGELGLAPRLHQLSSAMSSPSERRDAALV